MAREGKIRLDLKRDGRPEVNQEAAIAALLEVLGIELEYAKDHGDPDYDDGEDPGPVQTYAWAPDWAVILAEASRPGAHRKAVLLVAKASEGYRAACMTIWRLSGMRALEAFIARPAPKFEELKRKGDPWQP